MRSIFTTFTAVMILGVSSTASAAGPDRYYNDEGAVVDDSGPVRRVLFEDGEELEGEVLRLEEDILYSNRGRHHRSLIPIKYTFIRELVRLSLDTPL